MSSLHPAAAHAHDRDVAPVIDEDGPASGRSRGWSHGAPPDLEALLVALTLSPATYSRNRFYEMYTSPEVKGTRRRANQLRSVVGAFVSAGGSKGAGKLVSIDPIEDGGAVIVYDVASIGMRRTVRLRSMELALVRYCVGRAGQGAGPVELRPRDGDGERITVALQRMSPIGAT